MIWQVQRSVHFDYRPRVVAAVYGPSAYLSHLTVIVPYDARQRIADQLEHVIDISSLPPTKIEGARKTEPTSTVESFRTSCGSVVPRYYLLRLDCRPLCVRSNLRTLRIEPCPRLGHRLYRNREAHHVPLTTRLSTKPTLELVHVIIIAH